MLLNSQNLKISSRGEKEMDNNYFLSLNKLRLNILGANISWVDARTYSSLIQLQNILKTLKKKQIRSLHALRK